MIAAHELADNAGVECTVSDNGAGISADFLGRIFEKGETDDADNSGVESEAGQGSTFRFSLPAKN